MKSIILRDMRFINRRITIRTPHAGTKSDIGNNVYEPELTALKGVSGLGLQWLSVLNGF